MKTFYSPTYCGLMALFIYPLVGCEKILFLVPLATTSEKHVFDPIINGLALDGHQITVVTSTKASKLPENVTEIIPFAVKELFGCLSSLVESPNSMLSMIFYDMTTAARLCHKVFNLKEFQPVLKEKYDLIFINLLFAQCFYGIVHKNQAPFILLNSFPVPNYLMKDLGYHAPLSTVPYPLLDFTDDMNFGQRVVNFVIDWTIYAYSEIVYVPLFESVYRKYFGQDVPSVKEIHRNVSLVMINSHFTSTYHRPIMPDVIEIGGIHCKDAEPLSKDLEDFVSSSTDGFIYFSFGTVISGSNLPKERRNKFLNVFSKLKQRILWKTEEESTKDFPSNVKLSKWFPQQDLLGHPRIRLFISHGGLLSTQQTIYHAVPALFFPMQFDQLTNVANAVKQGYSLSMDLWNFSEEELEASIKRILDQPQFQENVKTISSIYRDDMKNPVERAVFFSNFVLKHKGAPQLRSSGRNLNFIQFHSIDVILFITIMLAFIILLLFSICKHIFSKLLKGKTEIKTKLD